MEQINLQYQVLLLEEFRLVAIMSHVEWKSVQEPLFFFINLHEQIW